MKTGVALRRVLIWNTRFACDIHSGKVNEEEEDGGVWPKDEEDLGKEKDEICSDKLLNKHAAVSVTLLLLSPSVFHSLSVLLLLLSLTTTSITTASSSVCLDTRYTTYHSHSLSLSLALSLSLPAPFPLFLLHLPSYDTTHTSPSASRYSHATPEQCAHSTFHPTTRSD